MGPPGVPGLEVSVAGLGVWDLLVLSQVCAGGHHLGGVLERSRL